jgi:small subunit ribosomal protein S10
MSKLRIIVSVFNDVAILEEAVKTIYSKAFRLKKKIKGPIPRKTKRTIFSIPISPHKHKDSQEQFKSEVHSRILEIYDPTPEDLNKLSTLKVEIPEHVSIRIKELE